MKAENQRVCKCGNKTKGDVRIFYTNAKGKRKQYVYQRYECQQCVNKRRSGKVYEDKLRDNFFY